jgi:hypothetical protein
LATAFLLAGGCAVVTAPSDGAALDRLLPAVKGRGLDGMDEGAVSRELARPLELELPARVLVVGLGDGGPALAVEVADGLASAPHLVPVPALQSLAAEQNGDTLMQRLRLLAIRHRTPYIAVVCENVERRAGRNALALLYALVLPLACVPGDTERLVGSLEAALIDARTGAVAVAVASRVDAEAGFVFLWDDDDSYDALVAGVRQSEGRALADKLSRALVRAATCGRGSSAGLRRNEWVDMSSEGSGSAAAASMQGAAQ